MSLAALLSAGVGPASAAAGTLEVGVGRADITPPTGYDMMGWVRSDGVVIGQHTRLWARVIVLRQGARKIALVAEDLNGIPGGMLAAAAAVDGDLGYSEQNVLDSASHTHAAPTGFYNLSSYNSVVPTPATPGQFNLTGSLDPQLYAFEVRQLALAIRRADANLGPGTAGWGQTQLLGVTQNRSLEAHLANFGIQEAAGTGNVGQDPGGYANTIDPQVDVLRVDKSIAGRDVPVGMWSSFADHGTVNHVQFDYYNEDHHGPAMNIVESQIRRSGHVPAGQDVIDAYGNSDEGDQTAGIVRAGPAAAEWVGQQEAQAFLAAWQQAGMQMDGSPRLDWRWTRLCWCGQATPDGAVASSSQFGVPQGTGSEEGRGPLFDLTRVSLEGDHLPFSTGGPFSDEIQSPLPIKGPQAVPLFSLRVGDRMIVSVPGEMTVELGRRLRHAVSLATAGAGISSVVIAGLANEYASYFTTPAEFDAQHYEGGSTIYGRASGTLILQTLADLSKALVTDAPPRAADPYDPRNGVTTGAPPFGTGAAGGAVLAQPAATVERLRHATFSWRGGPRGEDRPLDRAFVTVSRLESSAQGGSVPGGAGGPGCGARRRVVVHLRLGRSVRVRRIDVHQGGRVRTLRGDRRQVAISLRNLKRGAAHVRIVLSTNRGRKTLRRTYHPCTSGHHRRSRRKHRRAHQAATSWQGADSDLGLNIRWSVDEHNVYTAEWEVPIDAPPGSYRIEVAGNHYSLTSATFAVAASHGLSAERAAAQPGRVAISLAYPPAQAHEQVGDPVPDSTADLTFRPATAAVSVATVLVDGRPEQASGGPDGVISVPATPGATIEVKPGSAQDGEANSNGNDLRFPA
ncbi:MAG: hypothetical protein NVSMB51_11840 [Solirubrobacteraceae bacterium]